MIYDLVDCNDPILKTKMEKFDFSNPPIDPLELMENLAETMLHHKGIGLSANQCGLPYRAFIMHGAELIPVFNPMIVHQDDDDIYLEEGCLSFPNLFVKIKRPRTIKVRYTEPNGQTNTRVFDGITARVFQHELDHLDGIRYTTRANKIHLEKARKEAKDIQRRIAKSQPVNPLKGMK